MSSVFDPDHPFDDPERRVVERRSHRSARALMLAVTLLASLVLLAWVIAVTWSWLAQHGV